MNLNEQQLRAINTDSRSVLILAVPGSGKTLVLVNRIVKVLKDGVSPRCILAITFTRKAAQEMKERLCKLIDEEIVRKMFIGTSHSFCLSILRRWYEKMGLTENFSIYNDLDKKDIIKDIKEDGKYKVGIKKILNYSNGDNSDVTPREKEELDKIYKKYRKRLKKYNAVDYDMILSHAIELMKTYPEVLEYYRNHFSHLFYDEYQDLAFMENEVCLTMAIGTTFVVGDDSQNIYTWRGTDIKYIMEYQDRHENLKVINLEYNYRSAPIICEMANNLISHNKKRVAKKIIATRKESDSVYGCSVTDDVYTNGKSEIEHGIIGCINSLHDDVGFSYKDIAILVRTNRQIDEIKNVIGDTDIPYQLVSRDTFWARSEIREVIYYLRVMLNPHDNYSVEKIMKLPHMGLTKIQVQEIMNYAIGESVSLYSAMIHQREPDMPSEFSLFTDYLTMDAGAILKTFMEMSMGCENGYLHSLKEQTLETRLSSIDYMLTGKVPEFLERGEGSDLRSFLDSIVQIEATDNLKPEEDKVHLMTVHCAKGLEWPVVIVPGCEEGTLPLIRKRGGDITEEERRLAYVALTRAKERAYFIHATERTSSFSDHVETKEPSRFLKEMGCEGMRSKEWIANQEKSGQEKKKKERMPLSSSDRDESVPF